MKALSVQQPYAQLIARGDKTVEVRSWYTAHRGDLLIVASANPKNYFMRDKRFRPEPMQLYAGCLIGKVRLKDCVPMEDHHEKKALCNCDDEAYAWELDRIRFVRPVPIVGRLGLFDVPDDQVVLLKNQAAFYKFPPPRGLIEYLNGKHTVFDHRGIEFD